MGLDQCNITMYNDSQSALQQAQNPVYHTRTKYIDIRYHTIRELVKEGEVELVKVHTKKNQLDTLMKVLSQDSFQMCLAWMGLKDKAEFIRTWEHQDGDCELRCGTPKP